ELQDMEFEPIIIVDASLRYEVDDPEQLEGLFDKQKVRQAPAETDADYFVLQMAQEVNAPVVSNDTYDRYREEYS
ncbi:MAG: NYN domain-containing protein, partial [Anaerolineales bacterium]